MQIKVKTPYYIDETTSVVIYPERTGRIFDHYRHTGRYCVEKDTFNKDTGCSLNAVIASDLPLKAARDVVLNFIGKNNEK